MKREYRQYKFIPMIETGNVIIKIYTDKKFKNLIVCCKTCHFLATTVENIFDSEVKYPDYKKVFIVEEKDTYCVPDRFANDQSCRNCSNYLVHYDSEEGSYFPTHTIKVIAVEKAHELFTEFNSNPEENAPWDRYKNGVIVFPEESELFELVFDD